MTLQNIPELALIIFGLLEVSLLLRLAIQKHQARKRPQAHPRQPVYEVGSPEYTVQLVGMVHAFNEQMAQHVQHLSEKTAVDIDTGMPDDFTPFACRKCGKLVTTSNRYGHCAENESK